MITTDKKYSRNDIKNIVLYKRNPDKGKLRETEGRKARGATVENSTMPASYRKEESK